MPEDIIKDLQIGSLSWIILVGPKCNHIYRRKREVWATQKPYGDTANRFEDSGLKDGNDVATSSQQNLEEARN